MTDSNHLTRRSITAGLWLAGYRGFARFGGLIKTAIVARILTPAQFGIFGVCSIVLNLFETFSETGIEQALIHKTNMDQKDLYSGWYLGLIRSLIISVILVAIAPLVARFFQVENIEPFIWALAITPIMRSLRNPNLVILKKQVNFQKESLMLGAGTLAEVVTGVTVSFLTRSVWGLISAIVAGALVELIISYLVIPRPQFTRPDWSRIKSLFNFGRWVWSSSALSYLVTQGDDIIVGKLLGPVALGFYQNAYKIASLPATQITGTISQVTFPAFASIQNDYHRLMRAVKKTLLVTAAFTLPFTLITILFAEPLTLLIYGRQWLPLVPALQVLSIYGATRAIVSSLGALTTAIGKPELITLNLVIMGLILVVLILPATNQFGITGTAWATVIASATANVFFLVGLFRAISALKAKS